MQAFAAIPYSAIMPPTPSESTGAERLSRRTDTLRELIEDVFAVQAATPNGESWQWEDVAAREAARWRQRALGSAASVDATERELRDAALRVAPEVLAALLAHPHPLADGVQLALLDTYVFASGEHRVEDIQALLRYEHLSLKAFESAQRWLRLRLEAMRWSDDCPYRAVFEGLLSSAWMSPSAWNRFALGTGDWGKLPEGAFVHVLERLPHLPDLCWGSTAARRIIERHQGAAGAVAERRLRQYV